MSKDIDNYLDLGPDGNEPKKVPMVIENKKNSGEEAQIEADFNKGRDSMYDLIEVGEDAITEMMNIAKQSQHPTAFSTLNSMLKTVADMHKDLLNIQGKRQKLTGNRPKSDKAEGGNTTNQNIFVGTTAELAALMEDMRKDKEDPDV